MEDNGTGVVEHNSDAAVGGTGDFEVACSGCSRSVAEAGDLGSLDGSEAVDDVAGDLPTLFPDEDPSDDHLCRVHFQGSSAAAADTQ